MAAGVWAGAVAELLDLTLPVNLDTNVLTITESPGFVMTGPCCTSRSLPKAPR